MDHDGGWDQNGKSLENTFADDHIVHAGDGWDEWDEWEGKTPNNGDYVRGRTQA